MKARAPSFWPSAHNFGKTADLDFLAKLSLQKNAIDTGDGINRTTECDDREFQDLKSLSMRGRGGEVPWREENGANRVTLPQFLDFNQQLSTCIYPCLESTTFQINNHDGYHHPQCNIPGGKSEMYWGQAVCAEVKVTISH